MKILLADALPASAVQALESAGHEVCSEPTAKDDALRELLASYEPEILVVRSTKVNDDALKASPALALVIRAGAGYDNVAVSAASDLGIFVANCPGKNANAVAELTIGLIIALDRKIADNVADAKSGVWNKKRYGKAPGLEGSTLGLIGLGNIGRLVAKTAKAMGLHVIAWSRSLTPEKAAQWEIGYCESVADVVRRSDIVSLHVASTPDTKNLADRTFFEQMKEGAMFINTARSSVVDEAALAWAIEEKGIRVGLDVFDEEPSIKEGPFESAMASRPEVYVTHHIGASTQQAQEAVAAEMVRVVQAFDESGHVLNCVNLANKTPATHILTVRHLDKVGVLAGVLDEMRIAEWNVQEMDNLIFSGARAACARIRFNGEMDERVLDRIRYKPHVLAVSVLAL